MQKEVSLISDDLLVLLLIDGGMRGVTQSESLHKPDLQELLNKQVILSHRFDDPILEQLVILVLLLIGFNVGIGIGSIGL